MADVVEGYVAPGFEAVVERFCVDVLGRDRGGAAFAAVVDGRPVVDIWGGYAAPDREQRWGSTTLCGLFSGTKGLVATCLLVLVQRGALDLDERVCTYWPEFAAHGKGEILVRHVVSHGAGLPGLDTRVTPREVTDDRRMASLLAQQRAICEPGARVVYHALTFGWLCGELVRRVDGRSVGRFFAEEVAAPLALDAWIGLPAAQEGRVAVMQRAEGFGTQERDRRADADPLTWSIWANPPRFDRDPLPANEPYWHTAEIPATNGIAAARSVARLYGCLAAGGAIEGTRIVSPSTLALGTTRIAAGCEPYLERPVAFGVGFQLQTELMPFGPARKAFGHPGAGGSVHGAWPTLRTGFSYVTNTLRESAQVDRRAEALLQALHDAVGSPASAR